MNSTSVQHVTGHTIDTRRSSRGATAKLRSRCTVCLHNSCIQTASYAYTRIFLWVLQLSLPSVTVAEHVHVVSQFSFCIKLLFRCTSESVSLSIFRLAKAGHRKATQNSTVYVLLLYTMITWRTFSVCPSFALLLSSWHCIFRKLKTNKHGDISDQEKQHSQCGRGEDEHLVRHESINLHFPTYRTLHERSRFVVYQCNLCLSTLGSRWRSSSF